MAGCWDICSCPCFLPYLPFQTFPAHIQRLMTGKKKKKIQSQCVRKQIILTAHGLGKNCIQQNKINYNFFPPGNFNCSPTGNYILADFTADEFSSWAEGREFFFPSEIRVIQQIVKLWAGSATPLCHRWHQTHRQGWGITPRCWGHQISNIKYIKYQISLSSAGGGPALGEKEEGKIICRFLRSASWALLWARINLVWLKKKPLNGHGGQ